jgi:hypothetical protein
MNKIEVLPFEPKDLDSFKPRNPIPEFNKNMEHNFNDMSREMVSLRLNGEVIAIFGVNHLSKDSGHIWLFVSEKVDRCKFSFLKTCASLMHLVTNKFRRLEAVVKLEFFKGHRFIKFFGFIPEGVLRYYDSEGNDYILYRYTKEK